VKSFSPHHYEATWSKPRKPFPISDVTLRPFSFVANERGRHQTRCSTEISPLDSGTFALVPVIMVVASVIATFGPIPRATALDPAVTLRVG
jgi:hypothetical protein